MAIAHFVFGAAMTSLVITFLIPGVCSPRTLVLVGGGWAMLPDLHQMNPIAQAQLKALHTNSLWTDLFWFHRTLDRLDSTDSELLATVVLLWFIVVTFFAERR